MLEFERVRDEIFVAKKSIVSLGEEEISFLKIQAEKSPLKRARVCAHRDNADLLHEMLIVIASGSYIHPHKHLIKSESFHIIEGLVDVVIFDDEGFITHVVKLGALGSGRDFFYRLSDSRFHTLILRSDNLVMHEVTNGPFVKSQTIQAPFAPKEDEVEAVIDYMVKLNQALEKLEQRKSQ